MRIITVNLPKSFLKAIDSLTGAEGLYPSRSELIRVAVREFLIGELETAKSFQKYNREKQKKKVQDIKKDGKLFVQVPIRSSNGITQYKTYRIVKR
ncbi:CopG family ribbon-helix-helix protein [Candidatus Harpocratesius sp.]